MVIGPVALSRRAKVPLKTEKSREQTVFEGGIGATRARNKGAHWRFITYQIFGLPRSEFEALDLYLTSEAGANYMANDVTVVDDWSVSRTGRWVDKKLKFSETTGRLFDVELTFRFLES